MDPKLSNLDPKLQDAYNRVMSGPASVPPSGQSPLGGASGNVPPAAPASPASAQTASPTPFQPTIAAEVPLPQASSFGSTIAFNANNAGKNQGTVGIKRGGSKIKQLVLGLGIIAFLVAYSVVWIYVFKLNVPYLPQF